MTPTPESNPLQLRPPNQRRNQPSIAIIVTSNCDAMSLRSCLALLAPQCASTGAKLVVAHAGPMPDLESLSADNIPITLVTAPSGTTPADLRRICAWRSDQNVIAFANDCVPEQISRALDLCRGWKSWTETGGRIAPPLPTAQVPSVIVTPRPYLSVVVPVHNGSATLGRALEAISNSDLPRELWELIVVDDGSTDSTPVVAAQFADRLLQLPDGPHGPGYARNRGFEMTLGECVAFVNADVMVQPDTLRRFYDVLTQDPDVGGVFGSYDAHPVATNFVSQYRNLLQHYYHQQNGGEAATFWSGCGAVRSSSFEHAGRFDEWHFPRRQLEDLELGQRIRYLGHRVLLRPEIQVTNLKRWTLRGILATEIFDRGVPWMRLVNRSMTPTRTSARSLRATKKMNIALTSLGLMLALLGLLLGAHALLGAAAACLFLVVIDDSAQRAFFRQQRGFAFAMKTIALDLLHYLASGLAVLLGWVAQHAVGEPRPAAVTEALSEMNVKTWPPVPIKRATNGSPTLAAELADDPPPLTQTDSPASSTLNLADAPIIELPPGAPLQ